MNKKDLLKTAKPILFNTEMVRAILDGRKTVTRRAIKPQYRDDEYGFRVVSNCNTGEFLRVEKTNDDEGSIFDDGTVRLVNPPYKVGDILYVRETYALYDDNLPNDYIYKACEKDAKEIWSSINLKWKPSIHMPRKAARIFLRVTDVRAEELQNITEEQAIKEGSYHGALFVGGDTDVIKARGTFINIWDSTIKKSVIDEYGWDANPFVWVIEFKRIEI